MKLLNATPEKQCDNCAHQEGRHYCLHHGQQVRNMDIVRCLAWSARRAPTEREVAKLEAEFGTFPKSKTFVR